MPVFTVVAGTNGCGKSTLTKTSKEDFQGNALLDPDAVARRLTMSGVSGSEMDAAREVLDRCESLLSARQSFAAETTLSGHTYLKMMKTAHEAGYIVRFIYIGTADISINLQRVRDRVAKGGHDIPEEDQRRRYARSFANLRIGLNLADEALLLDNSTPVGYTEVAIKENGVFKLFEPLPEWAAFLREMK